MHSREGDRYPGRGEHLPLKWVTSPIEQILPDLRSSPCLAQTWASSGVAVPEAHCDEQKMLVPRQATAAVGRG